MAKATKPLTDKEIRTAKPKEKAYKLFDGGGLFLSVPKSGQKRWRLKYRINGKEKLLSLGIYPTVSLSDARKKREELKELIAKGVDPSEVRQKKKETKKNQERAKQHLFKRIALERLEQQREQISLPHYKRTLSLLTNYALPSIGDKPLEEITARDIIEILQVMRDKDIIDSAKKLFYAISATFKSAVANGYLERNPCNDIQTSEILGKQQKRHYPTITDDKGIANLLISIEEYGGELSTKYALLLLAYTAVRPSNARLAKWEEIDLKSKLWVIPAKKMKTRDEFIVPLSGQVVALIEKVKQYKSDSVYLFPSTKSKSVPLSDGALLGAIRRMGYSTNEFTPHGFRAMFSTIAHEKAPHRHEVIETQLAHSVGNEVSQAYNRAKYLEERVALMQWWGDYLEGVKRGK